MRNYLAVYVGSTEAGEDVDWTDDFAGRFMDAWGAWAKTNEAAIVDGGTPIGKTKRADRNGISGMKNMITGYVIVRAESHDEAAKMFDGHPHTAMLPGTWIEVMECLDMSEVREVPA